MKNNETTSISAIGEKVVVKTGQKVLLNNQGSPVVVSKQKMREIPDVSAADFVQALREAIDRAGGRHKMAEILDVGHRTVFYWQIGKKLPRPEKMARIYVRLVEYAQVSLPEDVESPVQLIEREQKTDEQELPSLGVSLIERPNFGAPRPIAANRRKK